MDADSTARGRILLGAGEHADRRVVRTGVPTEWANLPARASEVPALAARVAARYSLVEHFGKAFSGDKRPGRGSPLTDK
jgi:hypothetical protein